MACSYTQLCCRAAASSRASTFRALPSTARSISTSIPRSYAQHTDLPSSSIPSLSPDGASPPPSSNSSTPYYLEPETHRNHRYRDQPLPSELFTGTVSRVGTMAHCVQVTRNIQVWDKFLRKYYTRPERIRVHDPSPANFLREGDVVEYGTFTERERTSPKEWRVFLQAEPVGPEGRISSPQNQSTSTGNTEAAATKSKQASTKTQAKRGRRQIEFNDIRKSKDKGKRIAVPPLTGVQFVVRRVVTPFGEGLEQRVENLGLAGETDGLMQPRSEEGGQNTLVRGMGGNLSRNKSQASLG
ncbi:hypothetical protein LTR64_000754 [Lithohypha guttulata]|uniref:uncharacterized protein n=1 Tax=Lithohypha guttulata TaxID=1690604 RepID=UPI002DDE6539|nr:hypothetical protein LTR51_005477 [Lithohypha guttulata]